MSPSPNDEPVSERAHALVGPAAAAHGLQPTDRMMNTVKEIIYTVGDSTGAFAKTLGLSTRDLAKTVGTGTVKIAKDIGPKRALIGAAILAAAIGGGIVLVRYLRRREQEELDDTVGGNLSGQRPDTKIGRAERRAMHAAQATIR